MNKRIVVAGVCVAAALAFVLGRATAGDEKDPMEAMMEVLGTPGKEHAELAKCAGAWDTTVKEWRASDAPVKESTGSAVCTSIFDGRYITEEFHGSMNGKDFTGMSISGFNNATQKYFGTWIDSGSTGIMVMNGTKEGNKLTMSGDCAMPGGQSFSMRSVQTIVDDDTHTFDMFCPGPDGKEFRCMEITYKRKK